eukprot:gene32491-39283_t
MSFLLITPLLVLICLAVYVGAAGNFGNIVTDVDAEEDANSRSASGNLFNFASATAGAVILDSSPASAKGYHNLLNSDKDKYSISPCNVERRWVVIGLSEDIQITSVSLANYERYSSLVKDFQLLASGSYPTSEWIDLGNYTALPKLGEQTFNITQLSTGYTRYLKVRFLTHYLDEALCTLSQIKVHGLTIIASLKQEVELAQDHFDILQKLNQEEKAKMVGGSDTIDNETASNPTLGEVPENSAATDSGNEGADRNVDLNSIAGGGEGVDEVGPEIVAGGAVTSADDSTDTENRDVLLNSTPDAAFEESNHIPAVIESDKHDVVGESSVSLDLPVEEVPVDFSVLVNDTLLEMSNPSPVEQQEHDSMISMPISESSLQMTPNATQPDTDSIEESESASVVFSALQEMNAPTFNVSSTPANSSTLQKLQELIFSGSSIFKQLNLSPSQMGLLDAFVSFVHSQRDEQAARPGNTSIVNSSFVHSAAINASHQGNSSKDCGLSTCDSSTGTGVQLDAPHSSNASALSTNASAPGTESVDLIPAVANISVADSGHGGVGANPKHSVDIVANQAVAAEPVRTELIVSEHKVSPDSAAAKSTNPTEEVGAVVPVGDRSNATDISNAAHQGRDNSTTPSVNDTSHALLANQTATSTAASVAAANLSSLASFNCNDMMTFAEFQSKTLAKLSNKTEEYLGSNGFAPLHKDHNVFRALMQRIKNLEMNYILSEMYISQMSECMKTMSKEHQTLLVKHQEPFNKSNPQRHLGLDDSAFDDSELLLPLLPAAIRAAQTSLTYLTSPNNITGSLSQDATGKAFSSSPWAELLYIVASRGLRTCRRILVNLPLVNGQSIVQVVLQIVLKLSKEYTVEMWSLLFVSIFVAFTLMWILVMALLLSLLWLYIGKRSNDA